MTKPKPTNELMQRGRPSTFRPEYVEQAKKLCLLGATDEDIADFFNVTMQCINQWKHRYPELFESLKLGKAEANTRTEKSLYMRANGFHYDAVKIFCSKDGKVTKVPYRKYVIPDVTAGIFWLKNRDPEQWRDVQQLQSEVGHYIISDRPLTEAEWIEQRTKVIDGKVLGQEQGQTETKD
jgi:hypothetical protein